MTAGAAAAPMFVWPLRVYWEDTDGGGVVYHARYVHFFERARSEWLRSLGFHQLDLQQQHDLVFAIRAMNLEFVAPARMDDALQVSVSLLASGRASLRFVQHIHRQPDELIASATVYAACLTASSFKPRRIPAAMLQRIAEAVPAAATATP